MTTVEHAKTTESSDTVPEIGFFCDFDGTITVNDRIRAIVRHFAPSDAQRLITAIDRRQVSVRAGMEQMFALLPSARYAEIREFVLSTTVIRQGFGRFVDFAAGHGWPITVVSSGFDFFVEPALAPWRERLGVYCNRIDTSGDYLRPVWPYPCDEQCDADCGLCKPTMLRQLGAVSRRRIVIGDGTSDFEWIRDVDFVYARDKLLRECQRLGLPHRPFDTFDDIVANLSADLSIDPTSGGNEAE